MITTTKVNRSRTILFSNANVILCYAGPDGAYHGIIAMRFPLSGLSFTYKSHQYLNERRLISEQEEVCTYVESLFGVIKGGFQIVPAELRAWGLDECVLMADTCVILHILIALIQ